MLLGSCSTGLGAGGGFCAGSLNVIDHQRINGPSFVFSASMPALLAVSASEAINIFRNSPSVFEALQENVRAARAILDRVDCISIPSHPASPVIHIYAKPPPSSLLAVPPTPPPGSSPTKYGHSNPTSVLSAREPQHAEYELEERLLQEVVEEALAQGVLVTRAKRLKGQEIVEPRPSIRLALSSALSRKDTEKAVSTLKAVLQKVLRNRK